MDSGYPYYTATNTGQDSSSAQHHLRHQQSQGYARQPEQSSARQVYSYPEQLAPVTSSADNYQASYAQHSHHHQQHSPYHSPTSQDGMGGTLPPIAHSQGAYAPGATRYDGSPPQGGYMPSIGPTLHEPFSTSRSAPAGGAAAARNSWGHTHSASSRSPPHYGRGLGLSSSASFPPARHGAQQHPSLAHATHSTQPQLIPTPAQAAQTYHAHRYSSGSSSPGGPGPVVASIPPASGGATPTERFYCDKCNKSFGRAHDKKRHYESAHLQTHHECRYCHKCFSRNDSLKRHIDNGCEKDPSFQS
ncbi:uncharacterized protein TRAVEDRAFT_43108 [Trametes versicolor FP-101664 SS1]|uniref:uncharacterized protein n=1 Tax=Trametes versicolor (strain FP-101664) TaxID=717944 RepID=UPI0004623C1A|nr:uncharacterized protein TRAVEDRAFT_43108 [Trametes versicolor FP-101664 SS1]EIW62782.1 hypothetical protein TRAVEDRAFT_43108 [Trametes versicolor FP-101664 SS1]